MRRTQAKKHKLGIYKINIMSLSCFNEKRFVLNDGIYSLAFFHKDLKKIDSCKQKSEKILTDKKDSKDFYKKKRFLQIKKTQKSYHENKRIQRFKMILIKKRFSITNKNKCVKMVVNRWINRGRTLLV